MICFYDAEEMYALFHAIMEKNEAVHQLILGNIEYVRKSREQKNPLPEDVRFGVIFYEEKPTYFFCNLLPYNMVITAASPEEPVGEEICGGELAEEFNQNGVNISGIQAPKGFSDSFIRSSRFAFEKEMCMDIMVATDIRKYPLKGKVRRAGMEDIQTVSELWRCFVRDALHQDITGEEACEKSKVRLEAPNSYVWLYEVQGRVVGMNISSRQTRRGACINGVVILEQERKKGYCKEMMSWCSQYYLDNGYEYVTLYVDQENPFSNAAYQAVGYKYVVGMYTFTKKSEDRD